jgi:hypothetical protein
MSPNPPSLLCTALATLIVSIVGAISAILVVNKVPPWLTWAVTRITRHRPRTELAWPDVEYIQVNQGTEHLSDVGQAVIMASNGMSRHLNWDLIRNLEPSTGSNQTRVD